MPVRWSFFKTILTLIPGFSWSRMVPFIMVPFMLKGTSFISGTKFLRLIAGLADSIDPRPLFGKGAVNS